VIYLAPTPMCPSRAPCNNAATQRIRQNPDWKKLPIIMLTAKAMPDDQERCLAAGASDYMAKPLDVEKLLSLIRVWMPSN
jgi:CheY-like chemotaxis protein